MARSQRVSPENIEKVKLALKRNSYPSQQALAMETGFSVSTVKSFLNGKPVDYLNFVELSEKLGLDWQVIAYKEPNPQPLQTEESSPFITGPTIIHPRNFFGRQRELKRLFDLQPFTDDLLLF